MRLHRNRGLCHNSLATLFTLLTVGTPLGRTTCRVADKCLYISVRALCVANGSAFVTALIIFIVINVRYAGNFLLRHEYSATNRTLYACRKSARSTSCFTRRDRYLRMSRLWNNHLYHKHLTALFTLLTIREAYTRTSSRATLYDLSILMSALGVTLVSANVTIFIVFIIVSVRKYGNDLLRDQYLSALFALLTVRKPRLSASSRLPRNRLRLRMRTAGVYISDLTAYVTVDVGVVAVRMRSSCHFNRLKQDRAAHRTMLTFGTTGFIAGRRNRLLHDHRMT